MTSRLLTICVVIRTASATDDDDDPFDELGKDKPMCTCVNIFSIHSLYYPRLFHDSPQKQFPTTSIVPKLQ